MKKIIMAFLMVSVLLGFGSAWGFDMSGWWIFKALPHSVWVKGPDIIDPEVDKIFLEGVMAQIKLFCEPTYVDQGESTHSCSLYLMSGEPTEGYADIHLWWDNDQMIVSFFMDIGAYTFSLPKRLFLPKKRIEGVGITWVFPYGIREGQGTGFGKGTYIIRRP